MVKDRGVVNPGKFYDLLSYHSGLFSAKIGAPGSHQITTAISSARIRLESCFQCLQKVNASGTILRNTPTLDQGQFLRHHLRSVLWA